MKRDEIHNQVFHRIGDTFGSLIDADHFLGRGALGESSPVQPAFNLRRLGEGGYEITLPLPAFCKEDIEVTVAGYLLEVKAEAREEKYLDPDAYLHLGFQPDKQERAFYLPLFIDKHRIRAAYHNGLLVLNLPKKVDAPESEVQHIQVE